MFSILRSSVVWVTFFVVAVPSPCLFADERPLSGRIVDLSHPFDDQTVYWPTEAGFKLERGPAGFTDRGYYYSANRFTAAEHGGTHIDAPNHFFENRQTVDEIPLERLMGPAACVDVSAKCAVDCDYQVSVEDLLEWEQRHNASLDDKIVLLRTGYAQHWPDRVKYLGTTATGREGVAQLHFPGLDPVAADWLVSRRKIRAVGIDTASIDHGQSQDFESHVRLCRDNVPALENVTNLEQLPPAGFTVIALPMKIAGGSGAPCRVVAIVPSE
ncbi:MAG: cyclase family protein [Pirellulales bacterium]